MIKKKDLHLIIKNNKHQDTILNDYANYQYFIDNSELLIKSLNDAIKNRNTNIISDIMISRKYKELKKFIIQNFRK